MSTMIESYVERRNIETFEWEYVKDINPFQRRGDYEVYSFLANVRNYNRCIPIDEPRYLPDNISDEVYKIYYEGRIDNYSESYLSLEELLNFDYEKDCRIGEDHEVVPSYKEFLGEYFFEELEQLKTLGPIDDIRIVFWFNN
jgi:hypothetical protein